MAGWGSGPREGLPRCGWHCGLSLLPPSGAHGSWELGRGWGQREDRPWPGYGRCGWGQAGLTKDQVKISTLGATLGTLIMFPSPWPPRQQR